MCRYHEMSNFFIDINQTKDEICPLGDKCHYAHGEIDLRKFNDVNLLYGLIKTAFTI